MNFEINEAEVKAILSKLEKLGKRATTGDILEQIAVKIKNTIYLRTQSGRDADGNQFKPYSPVYARKEGKTLVNLTKTGHLLNAMTQKVLTNSTAKVFFTNFRYPNGINTQELALIHNKTGAGRNKVVRNFFAVGDDELDDLIKIYEKEVAKIQKEVGL